MIYTCGFSIIFLPSNVPWFRYHPILGPWSSGLYLSFQIHNPLTTLCPSTQHCRYQFSCSVMSDSLWPHGLQQARLPCPSTTPGACLNSCPLSQWCHPTYWSSVVPFFSHFQSFPGSGSFWISWPFTAGGQSIGASASVIPMNIRIDFF